MQRPFQLSQKYILILFLLLSTVLGLLRFNSLQIGTSYDDAKYIILAESLASGQGYQLINFPRPQIERNFPPGWPLLLTPLTFLFPGNYSVLKFFTLILSLASVVLTYKIFSKRLQSPYLEILTGLVALNPLIIGTSVTVM
jgi:sensor histidine kinase YesM